MYFYIVYYNGKIIWFERHIFRMFKGSLYFYIKCKNLGFRIGSSRCLHVCYTYSYNSMFCDTCTDFELVIAIALWKGAVGLEK